MIYYDLTLDTALTPVKNTAAKVILIALSKYCNANGECFPSQQRLSDDTLVPIRTVIRCIHWLEINGYIIITKRPNKHNIYTLTSMEEEMTDEDGSAKMAHEVVSNITKLELANSNTLSSRAKVAHPNQTPDFESFWKSYPRRIGKGAARTAFARAIKLAPANEIIAAAKEYSEHCAAAGTEKQFTPHAATWLNGERWDDDLELEVQESMKTLGWLNEL
tara:strand:+ start:4932 stop:5588 length:657 start_codon:yes stop_codon:yes gene_type:complete